MLFELKKIDQILVWFVCVMLIISCIGFSAHPVRAQATKQSASLTPHAPILINSSSDFTPANGVSGGNGSEENPWIIENLSITRSMYVNTDGGVGRFCIFIQYTSDYFIIRNSRISNNSAICGIYLFNVSNGIIESNVIENNVNSGIIFQHSNNIKIINNTIQNHRESGISFISSPGTVISNNSFKSNQYADITSLSNTNVNLTGNDFETGISIDGAEPYIPGNPPTPNNQIYVWVTVIIIFIVFSALVLLHKKSKLKEEDRNIERKDDEINLK